jgi:exosortase E/protease (VPEID-CTERM system)
MSSARLPGRTIVWIAAVGLLPLLELALLSACFDASALAARGGWLAGAIGDSGALVRAALPVLAAALLVAAARLPSLGPALRAAYGTVARPWGALLGHLALFGVVVWLSTDVFGEGQPGTAVLLAWVLACLAAVMLWFAALIPGVLGGGAPSLIGATLVAGAGLGLLAAGAASVTREWWQPLGRSTLWLVAVMLRAFGLEVGTDPGQFLVGTPTFVVEITDYCSGYQGIGLMWIFLGAYLWLFRARLRFPRALWLLPLGTVLAWVLNAFRIAVLVVIGSHGHEEIAVGGFHYHAGTLLFCATALGLAAWAGSSPTFCTDVAPGQEGENPTAAYLMPFVALLATSLLTGVASRSGFDLLYGARVVVAGGLVWHFRERLLTAGWSTSWAGPLLGIAAFGIWLALAGTGDPGGTLAEGLSRLDPATRAVWLAFRLAGSVAVVPLVEELAFRGYLARRLTAPDFESVPLDRVGWLALLGSALLFGLMHRAVLAGTAVGVLYGLAARRRGQLADAVVAHAVTNALLALTVLATGRWALWQ